MTTSADKTLVPSYIGRCPGCNEVVAATVGDKAYPEYREFVAKEVAEWIREGLKVEHSTVAFVRQNFGSCKCPAQMELLEEPTP